MKRFLYILGILAAFAIGHGIGREQGKELARTEHARGYAAGERTGYLGGVTDQLHCASGDLSICQKINRKLDLFPAH